MIKIGLNLMNSSILKQGSIVIGNLPYSDLSTVKKRPLLIISADNYNISSYDVIVIKVTRVTSDIKIRQYSIDITNNDLSSGHLKQESAIKVDSIFYIDKKLIDVSVASIKREALDLVKNKLKALLSIK